MGASVSNPPPDWDARSEARIQRLRDTISASTARIISAFFYYTDLSNRALIANDLGTLTRLDSIESRLSVVEKRLNLPPGV
jgi:hypothetical protein